jgi:hypothetical protein
MKKLAKVETPVLVWDYSAIENEAPTEIIQAAAVQIKTVLRRTAENVIELGKLLTVVRDNIPHGSWESWVIAEIGVSTSTAGNWVRAYKHADQFRAIANLSPTAVYTLAGADVPAEAIETVNRLAESGERVTKADVDLIVGGLEPITATLDRDPAEVTSSESTTPAAEVDHDVDRTRVAPEPAAAAEAGGDSAAAMKLARAAWVNLARLAVINAAGAEVVAREAWNELKASQEMTLGDNGKPCDATLSSFLRVPEVSSQ